MTAQASKSDNSIKHHWWPIGLQKHWADSSGDVWSIDTKGRSTKKKAKKSEFGHRRHGHTALENTHWKTNFEALFQCADNSIEQVLFKLNFLKKKDLVISALAKLSWKIVARKVGFEDICDIHLIEEGLHRKLLLIICSLLVRSPASRFPYESSHPLGDLPPDRNIEKLNLRQAFVYARDICESGKIDHQAIVLMHCPEGRFIFGDGTLDEITDTLHIGKLRGRALIPLTPKLCVYLRTQPVTGPTYNCASLIATPWMINRVNEIVQIYSKDRLFYFGKPPSLSEYFLANQFLQLNGPDPLLDFLDEVTAYCIQPRAIPATVKPS